MARARNDRKTDDIDSEWLKHYLSRFFPELHDIGAYRTPIWSLAPALSQHEWVRLRAAWRKHQQRQRGTSDERLQRAAMKELRRICAENGLSLGQTLVSLVKSMDSSTIAAYKRAEEQRYENWKIMQELPD